MTENDKKSVICSGCGGTGAKVYKHGDIMDEGYVWEGRKPTEDVCNICHGFKKVTLNIEENRMETTFSYYEIYGEDGILVYQYMINNSETDHEQMLCEKMDELSWDKGLDRSSLYYEVIKSTNED